MEQKNRTIGYDYLRIIATFMVVLLHGSVVFLNGDNTALYIVAKEINTLCLLSVPCFFMLSGALLLDGKSETPLKSLRIRLTKQGVPFLVWSLVYVFARIALKKIPFGIQAFTSLLQEPAYYQFWFMYTLLAIYLLTPIISALVQNINRTVYRYMLGIWLLFSVFQPLLAECFPVFRLSKHVDLVLCGGYVGYFLLGHYLKRYGNAVSGKTAGWLLAGGCLLAVVATWCEFVFAGEKNLELFSGTYLSPTVVLMTSGAFLLFQNKTFRPKKWITELSDISIGIFYVHMLVITAFEYVGFSGSDNLLICLLKSVVAFVVSALISFGISKIPGLRRVLLGQR